MQTVELVNKIAIYHMPFLLNILGNTMLPDVFVLRLLKGGHGGRVLILSPPTSEAGVR